GGVLLPAEDRHLQQGEDRMGSLVEDDEGERPDDGLLPGQPHPVRAAGALGHLPDQLVTEGDDVRVRVVPGVGLATALGLERQRLRQAHPLEDLGGALAGLVLAHWPGQRGVLGLLGIGVDDLDLRRRRGRGHHQHRKDEPPRTHRSGAYGFPGPERCSDLENLGGDGGSGPSMTPVLPASAGGGSGGAEGRATAPANAVWGLPAGPEVQRTPPRRFYAGILSAGSQPFQLPEGAPARPRRPWRAASRGIFRTQRSRTDRGRSAPRGPSADRPSRTAWRAA